MIGLDVLHNGLMVFSTWPLPPHVPLWSYVQLGLQLAFLLFVMATVRIPWSHLRSTGVPYRTGP